MNIIPSLLSGIAVFTISFFTRKLLDIGSSGALQLLHFLLITASAAAATYMIDPKVKRISTGIINLSIIFSIFFILEYIVFFRNLPKYIYQTGVPVLSLIGIFYLIFSFLIFILLKYVRASIER